MTTAIINAVTIKWPRGISLEKLKSTRAAGRTAASETLSTAEKRARSGAAYCATFVADGLHRGSALTDDDKRPWLFGEPVRSGDPVRLPSVEARGVESTR